MFKDLVKWFLPRCWEILFFIQSIIWLVLWFQAKMNDKSALALSLACLGYTKILRIERKLGLN